MTDISDEYIAEAALGDAYGNPRREKEENPFIRFINSGWGVAMICAIVSLVAVVALARWGQAEPPVGYSDRFEFSYEITYDDGRAWDGHPAPGDAITVTTSITNLGEAFGNYGFSAYALFVLQEGSTIIIEDTFSPIIEHAWTTIEHGQKAHRTIHIAIPEDAVSGVYDLVLSCDGVEKIFEGVMTVGESVIAPDQFSFSYEMTNTDGSPFTGSLTRGSSFRLSTTIVNQGAPFTHMGSSSEFGAYPLFMWSSDHSVTIRVEFVINDDEGPHVIETGEKSRCDFICTIPDNAPEGAYDLRLSCLGVGQVFEEVLTVIQIPSSDESVLHAWTGPYSEEKHIAAIETYAESYSSIDYGTSLPVTSVVFDAGFEVAECRVVWVGPYEYTAQNEPANAVEKDISCLADGRNIRVDTSWWYRDKAGNKTWAYLVCATDASGLEHHFYFRVGYSKYAPDVQDHILFAWEGEKTNQKLLAAIEEYTASYTPIDYGAYVPVNQVVINTDYAIRSCKLQSVGLLDYEDHEREANYMAELYESGITIPTDHQIIVNTSAAINEWSGSTVYSYLIQVTGTDGKQRCYYFRVDHEPFAGPFDLSYVPLVDSSKHILEAWTGEYSTEKHALAIEEYVAQYTPIHYGPDEPVTALSFELDFIPQSEIELFIHSVRDYQPDHELNTRLNVFPQYVIRDNRFYLNTQYIARGSSTISILIGLTDPNGVTHFYYFRIDSSVYQSPTEDET